MILGCVLFPCFQQTGQGRGPHSVFYTPYAHSRRPVATGRLPMTSVDTKIGSKTSCLALPTSRYSIHQPPCAPNLVGLAQTHDSAWSPTSFLSYHLQAQWSCRIWDHRDRESWFSETLSVEVGTSGRCFVFVFLSLLLFSERAEKKQKQKNRMSKSCLSKQTPLLSA